MRVLLCAIAVVSLMHTSFWSRVLHERLQNLDSLSKLAVLSIQREKLMVLRVDISTKKVDFFSEELIGSEELCNLGNRVNKPIVGQSNLLFIALQLCHHKLI